MRKEREKLLFLIIQIISLVLWIVALYFLLK